MYKHTICTVVSQWCKSLMMTVKVEFVLLLNSKWSNNHLNAAAIWLRTSTTQFSATTSISTLEPITGRKSETAIPRNIDGSRLGKTIRRSRYHDISKYQTSLHLVTPRPTIHLMISISIFWYYHDILILLHIMCGYQCDKAMTKNDTREVIWYHFLAVKWYHITSRFELSNQINCNNLVGPIRLHVIF